MEHKDRPTILFVDTQNTRLSPAAEIVMKEEALRAGMRVTTTSAGIEIPERLQMSSAMIKALKRIGYQVPVTKYTRCLDPEDLQIADLVLTFEDWQRVWLYQNFPKVSPKLYTINEYSSDRGEIVDPVKKWQTSESVWLNRLPKVVRHSWPLRVYQRQEQNDLVADIYVPTAQRIQRVVQRCLAQMIADPALDRVLA